MSVTFSLRSLRAPARAAARIPSGENGLFWQGDNGATVLLIHGMTGTPQEMRFIGQFLHRRGYTVSCPRLANHGEPIEILQRTRWQDCYDTARVEFRRLTAMNPTGPVFTSGLSMGALLALLLAEEFPSRVAGVSCLSPTLFYDGWNMPRSRWLLPLADATFLKHVFYFKEEAPYGLKHKLLRERIHHYYSRADLDNLDQVGEYGYPYFPVTLLCQLRRLARHLGKKLSGVTAPVQVFQAYEDDMTSVKNSQFLYDRVASEVKELILLYDSYHIITADQERETVARKMDEFFQRVRGLPMSPTNGQHDYAIH